MREVGESVDKNYGKLLLRRCESACAGPKLVEQRSVYRCRHFRLGCLAVLAPNRNRSTQAVVPVH
jgi:hypothetical protein